MLMACVSALQLELEPIDIPGGCFCFKDAFESFFGEMAHRTCTLACLVIFIPVNQCEHIRLRCSKKLKDVKDPLVECALLAMSLKGVPLTSRLHRISVYLHRIAVCSSPR